MERQNLLQARLLEITSEKGLINWSYSAVHGSFFPWKRGSDNFPVVTKVKGL